MVITKEYQFIYPKDENGEVWNGKEYKYNVLTHNNIGTIILTD